MLTEYANQSLTWIRVLTRSAYDEIATSSTSTIKGRKEAVNKVIRTAQGQEVVVSALILTASAVTAGDKIDGREVVSSEPLPDLEGSTLFYEVYTL